PAGVNGAKCYSHESFPDLFSLRSMKRPPQGIKVFFAVAVVLGAGIVFWQFHQLQQHHASLQWPVVKGKILQSELDPGYGGSSHERAKVTYSYVVSGARHSSH